MCLILVAHQPDTACPLLVAANRDEFHARPTATSAFWQDHPQIFAGRDLRAGGTWMGVNRQGRFAAITNYRDPDQTEAAPRSRGELTTDFLASEIPVQRYLQEIAARTEAYAGFNLLLGEAGELWYLSNCLRESGPRQLGAGVYGLSNARLDTPWPKVMLGKQALQAALGEPPDHQTLASVVANRNQANATQLRGQGLDGEMDAMLSAQFIVNEAYGTRATTTLWQDADGRYHWREASFTARGEQGSVVEQIVG